MVKDAIGLMETESYSELVTEVPKLKQILSVEEEVYAIFRGGAWLGEITFMKRDWDFVVPEPGDGDNIDTRRLRKLLDKQFDKEERFRLINKQELLDLLFEEGFDYRR